jgi:thioesterase domain-containing protein
MARQLETAGERAVFVAIIEGYAPTQVEATDHPSAPRSERWLTIARSVPYWWNDYLRLGAAEVRGRVRRSAASAYRGLFRRFGAPLEQQIQDYLPHDIALLPRHQRHLMETQLRASHHYAPGYYGGRVTLFRANRLTINRALFGSLDQEHGWGRLCAGVDTIVVEGGHQDLYLPPHVHSLAAAMRQCLDDVVDA